MPPGGRCSNFSRDARRTSRNRLFLAGCDLQDAFGILFGQFEISRVGPERLAVDHELVFVDSRFELERRRLNPVLIGPVQFVVSRLPFVE